MPSIDQIFTWEGISLPSYWGGNWGTATADVAFNQIQGTGASSVAIIPSFYMANKNANTMGLVDQRSETIAQTRAAMIDVSSPGMNVMLKPHVESLDYTWRAEIAPTDTNLWFQNYKTMMLQYAQLAQEMNAPMLCIGTEMKSLSGAQYQAQWEDLIASIRAVYGGKLTYAATYDEVKTVSFWSKVDYIGVDGYVPLTTKTNPTVAELVDGWTKPSTNGYVNSLYGGKSVVDFYKGLSEQYGKKVIFTEIGYRSRDGNNMDPGPWQDGGTVDQQEQTDCYEALFKVMKDFGGQWLDGAFLWSYHPFEDPVAHGVQTTDFTPQNKPANTVLTSGYSNPTHVPGLVWAGTTNADKLDGGYNNDTLDGGQGNDTLWGGNGDDVINGGSDADLLSGAWGNDTLDGGTGTNTAVFSGLRNSYTVLTNSDGTVTVFDNVAGRDGADLLKNIQFAKFSDQTVSLAGTPTNGAPNDMALAGAVVNENTVGGTPIGTLSATDPNPGDTLTYAVQNDPDNKFQIVGSQLQVRAGASLDFETKASHQVTVRVTDQGGLWFDKVFTIGVSNVNEAPTGLTLSNAAISENSSAGTLIGTLAAVDPDTGGAFTYSVQNDPDGKFQVVGNQLQIRAGAVLDFEAKSSHQVTVRVTDQGGLTRDQVLTISVLDAVEQDGSNQAPTGVSLSGATIDENSAAGALIGALGATDPNAGDTFAFSIQSDPDSKFQVVGNQLQLRPGSALDFETKASHPVTIRVTDQGGLSFNQVFSIGVANVNEAPTGLALSNARVLENNGGGTLIGTLAGMDPDSGSVLTYAVRNDPDGKFQVVGNQLQVRAGASLDYETRTSHQLTLKVTDQGGLTYDKVFSIGVADIRNEKVKGTAAKDVIKTGAFSDTLDGAAGNDVLYSGAGRDVLKGGSGRDMFVFDTTPRSSDYDRISDFSARDDTIWLARSAFSKIGNGALKNASFWAGAHAHDSSDRVIYDQTTGTLFYDPDGTGHAAQIRIAVLTNKAALTAHDFTVV